MKTPYSNQLTADFPFIKKKAKLPFLINLIFILTPLVLFGEIEFLGYRMSGWGWFIPFIFALLILARRLGTIKFPVLIWLPWAIVVIIYLLFPNYNALQRSLQLLCPIVVGMAVSTYRFEESHILRFFTLCRYLAIALIIVVVLKTGVLLTGALPWVTGLAPQVMTGMLLCNIFAAQYVYGMKRAFSWWGILSAIPVIALTRTAIVATGLTLPLTFAPLKIRKRVFILIAMCILGFILFYTPRIQSKMFYSEQGEMSDVVSKDFRDTGRFRLWDYMMDEIEKKPWFGHGANVNEKFIYAITGSLAHPHNDWLRLLFDYGYFGAVIFALCIVVQVVHLLRKAWNCTGGARVLFYAGASSFISLSLLMVTDNIIIYTSYFNNLQFLILGIAYASFMSMQKTDTKPQSRTGMRWR